MMSNTKILFKADKNLRAEEIEFLMMHLENRKASGGGPIVAFKQLIREDKAVRKQHLLVQYESAETVHEMLRKRFVCYKSYLLRVMPFVPYSSVCKRDHALRMNECYEIDPTRMLVRCMDHQIEELALLLSKSPGITVNSLAKSRLDPVMYHLAFSAPFSLDTQSTSIQFFGSYKTNSYVIYGSSSELNKREMKKKLQIICEVFVKENPSIESCWVDNWGPYLIVEFDKPVERFEHEFLDQDFFAEYLHNYELLSQDDIKLPIHNESMVDDSNGTKATMEAQTQTDEIKASFEAQLTKEAQNGSNTTENQSSQTESTINTESRSIQTDEIAERTETTGFLLNENGTDSLNEPGLKLNSANSTELGENLLALASSVSASINNMPSPSEPASVSNISDMSIVSSDLSADPLPVSNSDSAQVPDKLDPSGSLNGSLSKSAKRKRNKAAKKARLLSQTEPLVDSPSDTILLVPSISSESTGEQTAAESSEKVKPVIAKAVSVPHQSNSSSVSSSSGLTNTDSESHSMTSIPQSDKQSVPVDCKENDDPIKDVKANIIKPPDSNNNQPSANNRNKSETIPNLMDVVPNVSLSTSSLVSTKLGTEPTSSTPSVTNSTVESPSASPSVTILFHIDPNLEPKVTGMPPPSDSPKTPSSIQITPKVVFDGASKSLTKTVSCKQCLDEKDKSTTTEKQPPVATRKVHDPLRVSVEIDSGSLLNKCLQEIGQFVVIFMQLLNKRRWKLDLENGKYSISKTLISHKDKESIRSSICNLINDYNTKFLVHEALDVNRLFKYDSRPEQKMVQFEANVNMKFSYINKIKFEFIVDANTGHKRLSALGNIRDVRKFLGTVKNSVPRILAPHDNFDYLFPECLNSISFDEPMSSYKRSILDHDLDDYYSSSKRYRPSYH